MDTWKTDVKLTNQFITIRSVFETINITYSHAQAGDILDLQLFSYRICIELVFHLIKTHKRKLQDINLK